MSRHALSVVLILTFVILGISSPALAKQSGPYFNVNVGSSEYDVDITNFGDSTSYSLGVGYSLNRNFAVEGNFIDFGDAEDNLFPVWTINATALEVCGVGKIPFNNIFSIYAKAGIFSWDADVEEEFFGLIAEDSGTDVTIGLGLLLNLGERAATYFNYQNYDITLEGVDVSLDNYSFGFQLYF